MLADNSKVYYGVSFLGGLDLDAGPHGGGEGNGFYVYALDAGRLVRANAGHYGVVVLGELVAAKTDFTYT